jgi:hypothetical protein
LVDAALSTVNRIPFTAKGSSLTGQNERLPRSAES